MKVIHVRGTLYDRTGEPIEVADYDVVPAQEDDAERLILRTGFPVENGEIIEGYTVLFKENHQG